MLSRLFRASRTLTANTLSYPWGCYVIVLFPPLKPTGTLCCATVVGQHPSHHLTLHISFLRFLALPLGN